MQALLITHSLHSGSSIVCESCLSHLDLAARPVTAFVAHGHRSFAHSRLAGNTNAHTTHARCCVPCEGVVARTRTLRQASSSSMSDAAGAPAAGRPPCRRFVGKRAIVTAATAGIGLGIARRLAQEGARVFICSRKRASVDATVAALRAEGLDVAGVACHVGDAAQRAALVAAMLDAFGGSEGGASASIDVLVSNAAVNPTAGPLVDMPLDALDKIMDINVKATLALVQAAAPHMRRGGRVVLISSVTAYNPPAPIAAYAVSKTALLGLAKALASELGPRGITVNAVAPGIVPTKFSAALVADPELERAQVESTALKRLGTPEDIAAAVAFLASEDGGYVTGETLVVAGGMSSRL